MGRINLKDALEKLDEEQAREDWELWGQAGPSAGPDTDLFNSPKFQELVHLLLGDPILVSPTLNFLRLKKAQMSQAQLQVLYSPEELEQLYADLEKQEK